MLKEKHILNEYWVDAVIFSVYILNRSPTKSVKDRVPQEAWSDKSCIISLLRIFWCVAYAHVPKEMRRKLDDKSEKCILVGYSEESKEDRLYNPITKKYVISRDVEFKEEEAWDGIIDKIVAEGDDDGDE